MEPMLFTARLHLRPLQFSDASAMTALANDFDIARMTVRLPFPYRRGDSDWWIARHRSFGELAFAILANGQLVGCCGIDEPAIAAPEIGYWIGKPYWRRGFATEAVRALVAFAFEDARCNEVVVSHFVDNTGSRSVILRAGFVPVGTSERFSLARAADVLCVDYALRRAQAQVLGLARDRPPWLSRPATEGMCRGLMFRRPRPTLRTARLCLRPLAASDADSVMAMAGDPRVARMLSDMPHPATRPEILRWLAHRPGEVRFAIELDGRMIGSIGYFHERLGCAELGYWRWRFVTDSAGLAKTGLGPVAHTLFQMRVAGKAIDLRRKPFLRDETPPPFRIAPDGRTVLYLADQDADEALELYLSLIDVERVRRSGSPRDP